MKRACLDYSWGNHLCVAGSHATQSREECSSSFYRDVIKQSNTNCDQGGAIANIQLNEWLFLVSEDCLPCFEMFDVSLLVCCYKAKFPHWENNTLKPRGYKKPYAGCRGKSWNRNRYHLKQITWRVVDWGVGWMSLSWIRFFRCPNSFQQAYKTRVFTSQRLLLHEILIRTVGVLIGLHLFEPKEHKRLRP